MKKHGRCLCGKVKFSIETPTKWCAHCHCTQCRRAHGAALVTWFGVKRSHWHLDEGQDSLKWFASSEQAQRGFCNHCGSTLFFQSSRWPDEMHIVLANMTDALDRNPEAHVFYETHVDWLEINDGLKTIHSQ